MGTKRILIIGAGANQVGIIATARRLGYYVVAMDGSPSAPGLAGADAWAVADICSADAVLDVASRHRVEAIYPAAEWGVTAAAIAAERLGLPGPGGEAGHRARDKASMREALAAAGVPGPAFRRVRTWQEARAAGHELGCPLIVKPADGNASRGVTCVDHLADLSLAFSKALRQAGNSGVLLEAFMEGEEYNVDGLVIDGQYRLGGITGKERSDPPCRFDWGIFMPPLESPATVAAIEACVAQALRAIGFACGTTHVEVILTSEGARIVEIAGRPGGGRIPSDLIPLTYGIDYVADSLRVACGEAPCEARRYEHGAALYWIPAHSGVVTEVAGLDEARVLPGVHEVVMHVQPGDHLRHVVDCVTRDKIGYVLASGDSVQEAIATAKQARALCRVHTQPTIL